MKMIAHVLRHSFDGACSAGSALWRSCLAGFSGLLLVTAQAAEPAAVVTVLEGSATVIVGPRALAAAPGARLGAGTLVETDATTGLLRLEWPDGTLLDLGPSTRVMLQPGAVAGRAPLFYLLQGWAKQSQTKVAAGQAAVAFDAGPFSGVLVSQVEEGQSVLFAETGGGPFTARRQGVSATLKAGESAVLSGNTAPQVSPRPPLAWLKQMPKSFRETLPPMANKLKGPAPTLRPRATLTYSALQPWLVAEPAIRRDFHSRFAELLGDRVFRDAVTSQLAQHPEWEAVLKSARAGTIAR
jgi:hypothetical protein